MMSSNTYHISVLLHECIEALNILPNENYVDVTFGGGGHSKVILENLQHGKLIAFDQDDDAKANLPNHPNLIFANHNFRYLKRFLTYHNALPVSGILADLGISSYQIDTGEKGFSVRFDGPLDMRMNADAAKTAADILHTYSEQDLVAMFSAYGELRNSKTLALAIVNARKTGVRFETTQALIALLNQFAMGNPNKYYAQVFQALRIEVNDEMNALKEMLQQSMEVLKPGGRLVVITFHSLEDRIVKNFLKSGNFSGEKIQDEFGKIYKPFRLVNKKPIEASKEELKINKRSRSAKLRVAERI